MASTTATASVLGHSSTGLYANFEFVPKKPRPGDHKVLERCSRGVWNSVRVKVFIHYLRMYKAQDLHLQGAVVCNMLLGNARRFLGHLNITLKTP